MKPPSPTGYARLLRIRPPRSAQGTYIDRSIVREMLTHCFVQPGSVGLRGQAIETDLTTSKVVTKLGNLFHSGEEAIRCLVVDFSSDLPLRAASSPLRLYDHLSSVLHTVIGGDGGLAPRPFDILIFVSSLKEFQDSVFVGHLAELCSSEKIGLLVMAPGPEPDAVSLGHAGRLSKEGIKAALAIMAGRPKPKQVETFTAEQVLAGMDMLLGHFRMGTPGQERHVPVLVSFQRLLDNNDFRVFVRETVDTEVGHSGYLVRSFEIQGGELESLALWLVDNDASRLLVGPENGSLAGKAVVIVSDVLSDAYPIRASAEGYLAAGASKVMALGLAKYASFKGARDLVCRSYVDLPYAEYAANACPFCKHGDKPLPQKQYFAEFAAEVGRFHPYTFWELVSDVAGGHSIEHWPSKRTGYHYHHRVLMLEILEKHGYGIACRIRNGIRRTGIFDDWVQWLVCPDEPEAVLLAKKLADLLRLPQDRIVSIEREVFSRTTGTSVPEQLPAMIAQKYGDKVLNRGNVIILDQAAHHFGTLYALEKICSLCGANVLAFAVVLDRSDPEISLAEALPRSHYVSLYTWPWPPFKGAQCPCRHKNTG